MASTLHVAIAALLLVSCALLAGAAPPSPPDIGNEFVTNISMNRPLRSGVMYGSDLFTLFVQTKPEIRFPNQLNLCDHGQSETYVAFNPANNTCSGGVDPLYCRNGETCNKTSCIALFDNPFMGLPFTELKGTCEPSGANKWVVSNGGYVLTYCITARAVPLSLYITGAGGNLEYNFTNFHEQRVPPKTFDVPSYCKCPTMVPPQAEQAMPRRAAPRLFFKN
eukprot:m.26922 g.26922  ORF g.26922 m.26922 type:complete len:222 (+) comp8970_c0_seq1:122-787(+)